MASRLPTVQLYADEPDGIAIRLTPDGDITSPGDYDYEDAVVRVVGHRLYCCSSQEAETTIRDEYLARKEARNG